MSKPIEVLPSPFNFLEKIFNEIQELNIDISSFECDHICYRVETYERYKELKNKLQTIGEFLSEEIIANRPISTFKLFAPIKFKDKTISCLELPAPKENSSYNEGFEHIEFVINESFSTFMQKYPNLTFKISSINKQMNPEISLELKGGTIKFHHNSLEYVVKYLQT
ncbi:MAG: VOC family protein [Nanoarchaeota archaeon]|nr:VOC family protein [Nanoarchaeota archaeon]